MFNAFFKFLDNDIPSDRDTLHNVKLSDPLYKSAIILGNHSNFLNKDDAPETAYEKIGRGLYERGMQQKERRKREIYEASIKKERKEIECLRKKPSISPISKQIVKELKRGDVVTENEKWLSEKNAKIHIKKIERNDKEIEENERYKGKKWKEDKSITKVKTSVNIKKENNIDPMSQKNSFLSYFA